MSPSWFSGLPWFAREEIMGLTLVGNKEYRFLSKEWFKFTVAKYGVYHIKNTETRKPLNNLVLQSVDKIHFDSIKQVDWDQLSKLTQVKKLVLNAKYFIPHNNPLTRYILTTAPPLTSLTFLTNYSGACDVISILQAHHTSLEELVIRTSNSRYYEAITEFTFPNLKLFEFTAFLGPFPFKGVIPTMPKLEVFRFTRPNSAMDFLRADTWPTVQELKVILEEYDLYRPVVVDLNNFPSLKRVEACSDIGYANAEACQYLEELVIHIRSEKLYQGFFNAFSRLKSLFLKVADDSDNQQFHMILPLCTNLTKLQLRFPSFEKRLPTLPVGSYPVTHLKLAGDFLFNNSLLSWLSNSFQLLRLEIQADTLEVDSHLESFSFPTLHHVILKSKYKKNLIPLKRYFSNRSQFQLDYLEVHKFEF